MRRLVAAFLLACTAAVAHADGGRLQMRQAAGPFIVSLFSTPESLAVGQADLSVMVEEREGGRVLLDADIVITLTPQDTKDNPIVARLSHAHATNRLLQDTVVELPRAGRWHVAIEVNEGGRRANMATDLIVGSHSARRGTVWFFGLLPVLATLLFIWVQVAKRATRQGKSLSPI